MTDHKIPIAKPELGEAEAALVRDVLLSGWVTQGPQVQAFETEFAAYVGAKYASAVSNCTTGLHLALKAVGVSEGDEVITVSHSFIATANAIRYCGAIPVFCDINPRTYNIDPQQVEALITDKTKAILAVHQVGMPCDMEKLVTISKKHDIPLVEDAACAIGSEIFFGTTWQKIGAPQGDIAVFSFHPRKVITTGDGGMLTTNNPDYQEKFTLWRQHSMTVRDTKRHNADTVTFTQFSEVGYNYRMTDIQAAVGREQLKRLPELITQRRVLAERYLTELASIDGLILPHEPDYARSNWQSFIVRLPEKINQCDAMQQLLNMGISTRRAIMNAHREPAYEKEPWRCAGERPHCDCALGTCKALLQSEYIQDNAIAIPLFSQMTDEEQSRVIEGLRVVCLSDMATFGTLANINETDLTADESDFMAQIDAELSVAEIAQITGTRLESFNHADADDDEATSEHENVDSEVVEILANKAPSSGADADDTQDVNTILNNVQRAGKHRQTSDVDTLSNQDEASA